MLAAMGCVGSVRFGSRRASWIFAVAVLSAGPLACDDGGSQPSSSSDDGGESTTGGFGETTATGLPPVSTSATPTSTSTSTSTTNTPSSTSTTTATTDSPDDDSSSDDGDVPNNGWFEVGYGLDEFFPFSDELPVYLGPQGFMMFSLPLRGGNFPVPPDPTDFEHPDTPILTLWTDVEGIDGPHPSGHFAIYQNYPVPFRPSLLETVDVEFVSVWLVIPEDLSPAELEGREVVVHGELQCADGQFLVDEHVLTIVDGTDKNPAG